MEPDIAAGRLVSVLDNHLPDIPSFHIYFASRAQVMLKLRVFIEHAAKTLA